MTRTDRVTDISTSKKLVKWMGKETDKVHQTTLDCDMNVVWHIVDRFLNGFERTEGTGEVPVVPAYDFLDLIERLPKGLFELDGIAKMFNNVSELPNALAELVIFCGENNYLQEGEG